MGKLFSEKKKKIAGVFQVSILNPILFLIYISNLPVGTKSICKIFADETSLF